MPKLDNWSVIVMNSSPYQAPEQGIAVLHGVVTEHDGLPDGGNAVTSRLLMLDTENNKGITLNTVYELGTPSTEWLTWLDTNGHKLEDYNFDKRI